MLRGKKSWHVHLADLITYAAQGDIWRKGYAEATVAATRECVAPSKERDPNASSAFAVINIAAQHVPDFCARSRSGVYPAYQNCYNLGTKTARGIGDKPDKTWAKREIVDSALQPLHGCEMGDVYFAALELNGAGVRFYGDFCFVLKPGTVMNNTVVLDRNSFDLIHAPLSGHIEKQAGSTRGLPKARAAVAAQISGHWDTDTSNIAATKVLEIHGCPRRRITTGQISEAILDDEDYIEVLKIGSIEADDLQQVRLSADDVALEHHIEQRLTTTTPPAHEAQLWLEQRRDAVRALRDANVDVVVVTSLGRSRK